MSFDKGFESLHLYQVNFFFYLTCTLNLNWIFEEEFDTDQVFLCMCIFQDPKEKLILSLKREIKLLRTENAYFRQQVILWKPFSLKVKLVVAVVKTEWLLYHPGSFIEVPSTNQNSKRWRASVGKGGKNHVTKIPNKRKCSHIFSFSNRSLAP